jgi:hypothetical protein
MCLDADDGGQDLCDDGMVGALVLGYAGLNGCFILEGRPGDQADGEAGDEDGGESETTA